MQIMLHMTNVTVITEASASGTVLGVKDGASLIIASSHASILQACITFVAYKLFLRWVCLFPAFV